MASGHHTIETEQSFRELGGPPWRTEPFRVFFPLGVVFAWVGVSHWVLYGVGLRSTYSCELHGLVQMQAFMMSFAVGFLFTAIPRRTRSAPPTALEIVLMVAALGTTATGAVIQWWWLAQAGYFVIFLTLMKFAVTRFLGRAAGRRPPAAFVLVPFAIAHALVGSICIASASLDLAAPSAMGFGKLLVGQGVFLCLVVGIGSLVLPLVGGAVPPPDLGSSPRETRKALAYAAAGIALFASFVLEQAGWPRGGPLARAVVVAAALVAGAGAWRPPGKPGLHRRLIWIALWLVPGGLLSSALWPEYRIPALHILFIGGFGLMAFAVATHVTVSHLGLEHLSTGRPFAVAALAMGFLLALLGRIAADASDHYFEHLAWAAAIWLLASGIWLVRFGPSMLRGSER